ncbi:Hypothetical predicted protein [Pelobates cultripes]|uniref:Uncharacterized protein n=1 Tax=Pelobates cultripes TaxID=61616 RepID=A0AAD1T678_PELCU|nr:Hypothetical predicted protein [Pelobates cultripes]
MAANVNPPVRNGNNTSFSPSIAKALTHARRMLHTCMRQPDGWDPYDTQLQCLPNQRGCDARAHMRSQPTLNITERLIHRLTQAPAPQHMTSLPTLDLDRSATDRADSHAQLQHGTTHGQPLFLPKPGHRLTLDSLTMPPFRQLHA